jgi:hypothetical protein
MALRNGTSTVLIVLKVHIIVSMGTYLIKKASVRSAVLFQRTVANLILYIKMKTKRIKTRVI